MKKLLAILISCLLSAPASLAAADAGIPRLLLVLETSTAMEKRRSLAESSIYEIIVSGMHGQLREGDPIEVWAFNDSVITNVFTENWATNRNYLLASKALQAVRQPANHSGTSFPHVMAEIRALAVRADALSVVVYTAGTATLEGSPFDDAINSAIATHRREMQRQKMPFAIILNIFDRQPHAWSVHPGNSNLRIPVLPLPVVARTQEKEAPATAKPAGTESPSPEPEPKAVQKESQPQFSLIIHDLAPPQEPESASEKAPPPAPAAPPPAKSSLSRATRAKLHAAQPQPTTPDLQPTTAPAPEASASPNSATNPPPPQPSAPPPAGSPPPDTPARPAKASPPDSAHPAKASPSAENGSGRATSAPSMGRKLLFALGGLGALVGLAGSIALYHYLHRTQRPSLISRSLHRR